MAVGIAVPRAVMIAESDKLCVAQFCVLFAWVSSLFI